MNILKTSAQLLSGSLIYIFVFAVGDMVLNPELIEKHIGLISVFLTLSGFVLSFILNRFLFGTCIIKSALYSIFSFLILFLTAFLLKGAV